MEFDQLKDILSLHIQDIRKKGSTLLSNTFLPLSTVSQLLKLDKLNELSHYYSIWFSNNKGVQIISFFLLALFYDGFIECLNQMCSIFKFSPQHYSVFIDLNGFIVDRKRSNNGTSKKFI